MQARQWQDQTAFALEVEAFLLKEEAVNGLLLGLVSRIPANSSETPIMISISDDGKLVGCGFKTPSHQLVLSRMPEEAVTILADFLVDHEIEFPGVVAPKSEADRFAEVWERKSGRAKKLAMDQRIYELIRVEAPEKVAGSPRLAVESDIDLVEEWFRAFTIESLPDEQHFLLHARHAAEVRVRGNQIYLWEVDRKPVTMTGIAGPTKTGIRVNGVYTPPKDRRKGYASALVAHVSEEMLKSGKSRVFLYTDLTNPTSNGIYQKLGYKAVCDSRNYIFS